MVREGEVFLNSSVSVTGRSSLSLSSTSFPSFGEGKGKKGEGGKEEGKGDGKKEPKKRGYYVLFEDVLMICRVKEEKLVKKWWLELKEGLTIETEVGSVRVAVKGGQLVCLDFEKEGKKRAWLKALRGVTNVTEREKR